MPTCAGPPSTGRMGFVGAEICHIWVGAREVMQDSSFPPAGDEPYSFFGPPRCLLAPLTGRCARNPRRILPAPRSAPPTPQRQPAPPAALASVPSPRPSPRPGPGGHVFRSYDEQLRLAMELSAQEQEERRRRARLEEEELERILRLSLTEQ